MYIERIPHPTQFNVLCASQLFATTFTVINSSSNVVETSTLSVGNFTADYAKIGFIDNAGFITLNNTVTASSPRWNSVFTTVSSTSGNWEGVYTTVRSTSSNWGSVYTTVQNNSANYILQNGNSPSTTLLVGTNNTQPLHLEANGSARMAILSTGNVGIGTTTPTVRFEVTDNSTSDAVRITQTGTGNALAVYDVASDTTPFVINQDGKVGVGTASPLSSLHVRDTILTTPITYNSNQNQPYLIAGTTSHTGTTANWGTFGFQHRIKTNSGGSPRITIDTTFGSVSAEIFTIDGDGDVGIGITDPTSRLSVAGDILTNTGILKNNQGTDFVALLSADDSFRVYLNNNERLRVDSSGNTTLSGGNLTLGTGSVYVSTGNVGIGITTPTYKLTLSGTQTVFGVDNQAIFGAKNTFGTYESYLWPRWSDNATYFNYGSGGLNVRNNSGNSRIRVTDGGDIGIGTTSPTAQISLSAANTEHADLNLQSGVNARFWITQPNNLNVLAIGGNGTSVPASGVINITNTNRVGIGTTAPNTTLTVVGDISATSNATINGNLTVSGNIASQGIDFGNTVSADTINPKSSQQLVLNAGESSLVATGQTDELVYINAENGLRVTSSPNNWGGGTNTNWALRSSTLICGPSGNSAFGLSGSYINAIPQATVDIFGLLKFGNRSSAGIHAGGYLSNTWSLAESYKFFTLGSSYFDPIAARWITNFDTGWGSNVVANVAGDGEGIKFFLAPSTGNVVRSETTSTFNAYERMRIDTSGNVGIGVTSPNERLDVASSTNSIGLKIRGRSSDNLGAIVFDSSTGNAGSLVNYIQSVTNSYLAFATNNTERVRINAQGRVGIGTTNPLATLDVRGKCSFSVNISATPSFNPDASIATTFANLDYSGDSRILDIGATNDGGAFLRSVGGTAFGTTPKSGILTLRSDGGRVAIVNAAGHESIRMTADGLTISETGQTSRNPLAPLTFSNTFNGVPKIDLWVKNDSTERYGIGLASVDSGTNPGLIQIYSGGNGNDVGGIAFGHGQPSSFTETVRFRKTGFVHIGNAGAANTNTRLTINPTVTEAKITLWDNGSTTDHYGFGVSSGQLNYHTNSGSHVFYNNGKNGNGTELMRITSGGIVGIGTSAITPTAKMHIYGTGSTASNPSTSTNLGATLSLQDVGTATGNGGMVMFGAGQGHFAAIKGFITNGTTNTVGSLIFALRNGVADATLTERLRITPTGDIGIGTALPTAQISLSAANTEHADLNLQSGVNARFWITQPNNLNVLAIGGSGDTVPASGAVNITNTGNVGIGTSAPTTKLHLSGSANFTGTATSTGVLFNSHPLLERINIVAGTANGNTTIDAMTNTTWMFTTNSTADWTLNIRGNISTPLNSIMEIGDTVNITIISKQNNTSFNVAGLQIDGAPQTVGTNLFWEGGTAPTTGLSTVGYDAYTFTIVKRGVSSYTTFASQSRLG